jgi:cytochrome P450
MTMNSSERGLGRVVLGELAHAHPWSFYEGVRAHSDMVWDEVSESWLVSSYDLCKEISRQDQVLWRSVNVPDESQTFGIDLSEWIELIGFGSPHGLTIIEGDEHTEQHRWWMRTFSRAQLEDWRTRYFEPIMRRELAKFRSAGRAELVQAIADIAPRRMVAAVIGLPYNDDDLLDRLDSLYATRQQVIYAVRTGVAPSRATVEAASEHAQELHEALLPFVAASAPGTASGAPFLRHLWESAPQVLGEGFDVYDVTSLASAVWEAGTGTTKNGAANVLYLLATQPELQEVYRSGDPIPRLGLIEESLRLYGPVVVNSRTAVQDAELGGRTVKRGQRVVMLNNAAGVDPGHFACPYSVDLHRARPRDHFSFGQGPRACPGQHLARAELDVIATVVCDELRNVALDPEAEAPRLVGGLLRRWQPVNVTFGVQD